MQQMTIEEAMKLALHYHHGNHLDEAEAIYRQVLHYRPRNAEATLYLGVIAGQRGQSQAAVDFIQRAIELKPNWAEAYNNLGRALVELDHLEEALAAHQKALVLEPLSARTHDAVGSVLLKMGEMSRAAESFRQAVALAPDLASSWTGLGATLRAIGHFDEALTCIRKSLAIDPNQPIAYTHLSVSGHQAADTEELRRLAALLDQPGISSDDRIAAGFALAKLLDDENQFDEAFSAYVDANAIVKASRAAKCDQFEINELRGYVDEVMRTFTPQFFSERREWGISSERPVFIVGMPRSGTTLVEQIAASHPDVYGAGERKDIERIAKSLGGDHSAVAYGWTAEQIRTAATTQLAMLHDLDGSTARIIDKMPDNVLKLGLIALLFPSARVIICRRDVRDNCLSCYFQWFNKSGNSFSYDLTDCGRRYKEIDRLSSHWMASLPLKKLEVQYEDLVADLEGQSRRLIDFLSLPWDSKCLEFHKTERTVLTCSTWQVRQPIYTRSVCRWRHYERHLGPLFDALQAPAGSAV